MKLQHADPLGLARLYQPSGCRRRLAKKMAAERLLGGLLNGWRRSPHTSETEGEIIMRWAYPGIGPEDPLAK